MASQAQLNKPSSWVTQPSTIRPVPIAGRAFLYGQSGTMKENRAHYCVGVSEVPLEGLVVWGWRAPMRLSAGGGAAALGPELRPLS